MAIGNLRARHLSVFAAVARSGSMQRAAVEVHLTQPAVSKLIAELEAMFGTPLFVRSKRGGDIALGSAERPTQPFKRTEALELDRPQQFANWNANGNYVGITDFWFSPTKGGTAWATKPANGTRSTSPLSPPASTARSCAKSSCTQGADRHRLSGARVTAWLSEKPTAAL